MHIMAVRLVTLQDPCKCSTYSEILVSYEYTRSVSILVVFNSLLVDYHASLPPPTDSEYQYRLLHHVQVTPKEGQLNTSTAGGDRYSTSESCTCT